MKDNYKNIKFYHIFPDDTDLDFLEKYSEELRKGENYRKATCCNIDKFENMVFDFYGTHELTFKIGSMTLEVLEDPQDGYRSSLYGLVFVKECSEISTVPLCKVKIILEDTKVPGPYSYGQRDILYKLVDIENGRPRLIFGTRNVDDYYPFFDFMYNPKPASKK